MYEGVPCVVSKCDGNIDVIDNNVNGFSCVTREEYVETISLLLTNNKKAKQIGEAGKNYVMEHHDIKNNIKLLEKIYEEI